MVKISWIVATINHKDKKTHGEVLGLDNLCL